MLFHCSFLCPVEVGCTLYVMFFFFEENRGVEIGCAPYNDKDCVTSAFQDMVKLVKV